MLGKLPISAFIICKNEAQCIERCVRSVDLCSEIIVVDSGSSDGTLEILQRLTRRGLPIRVIHREWPGYAAQKQFALEQCTQPWCLSIDADEELDEELRQSLPSLISSPGIVGWRIGRKHALLGYGYTSSSVHSAILRLIRRGAGAYDLADRVHEGIRATGKVSIACRGSLLHFRALLLDEQILKQNAYSTLKADQIVERGKPRSPLKILVSPPYHFCRLYIARGLFWYGWAGFIEAMTGAVYSFLTEAKVHQRRVMQDQPARNMREIPLSAPAE
jgi:glycosyltransferase involved in cell wall biosynthesis